MIEWWLSVLHLYVGLEIPCVVCRAGCGSSAVRQDYWNREHRALKQHIWLGRLVQWWGITGLLPKYPGKDAYLNVIEGQTVKLYKPVTLCIKELLLLCNYSYKYSVTSVVCCCVRVEVRVSLVQGSPTGGLWAFVPRVVLFGTQVF